MFSFDNDKYYSMPVVFGGEEARKNVRMNAYQSIQLSYTVEKGALEAFLPEGFALKSAELFFSGYFGFRVDCHGPACGYGVFASYVNVSYVGNDEGLDGVFPLVIWQDNMLAVTRMREDSGLPVLYANIEWEQPDADTWRLAVGESANPFIRLEFSADEKLDPHDLDVLNASAPIRQFGWRYVPNVGSPGASISQAILCPCRSSVTTGRNGTAHLTMNSMNMGRYEGYERIVSALSRLIADKEPLALFMAGNMHFMIELARTLP